MFGAFLFGKEVFIILSNGTEVIIKPYREKDTKEIVRLIHRNFMEVNVKDYGEKAMAALSATHDVNWFKGVTAYKHVFVFGMKIKLCVLVLYQVFEEALWKIYCLPFLCFQNFMGRGLSVISLIPLNPINYS